MGMISTHMFQRRLAINAISQQYLMMGCMVGFWYVISLTLGITLSITCL